VGDFDTKQALSFIEKHFGPIPKGKPVPRVTATEPPRTAMVEKTVRYSNIPLDAVVNSYQLPPLNHPDRYALEVASIILSGGQSSRLYRRLVYEEQSAIAAAGEASFLEGPSLFFGFAIANQGKNIKEVANSLEYTFEEMKKEPVSDEELTKAKNQIIAGFITGRETMQAKADFLGNMAVLHGDPARYNTELANYQKVTAADVQRVVKQYLVKDRMTRMWVQPESAKPEGGDKK
jgi:zinc protease